MPIQHFPGGGKPAKCAPGDHWIPAGDHERYYSSETRSYSCPAHLPADVRAELGLPPLEKPAPIPSPSRDPPPVLKNVPQGAEKGIAPEPTPGSKPTLPEGSEEHWGVLRLAPEHDVVWVCRRTAFGRLELAATVHPQPGETLSAQIDRARQSVYVAFMAEAGKPVPAEGGRP